MSALVNMFQLGACTVSVIYGQDTIGPSPTILWSGLLALNQSSPQISDPNNPGHPIQVLVDGSGNVSLQSVDGSTSATPYSLRVYAPGAPFGEVGVSLTTYVWGATPYATCDTHNNVLFSHTTGSWLPNPATYNQGGFTFVGVG